MADKYDRFTYTETDAKGCYFVQKKDLTCHDCVLKYEQSGVCIAYPEGKPAGIMLHKGTCEYKRTE